jgi:ABC-type multidrug transport system fused ATPase/permease subunit
MVYWLRSWSLIRRGVKLSGGQRQRITIARAMLKNSKILILDEATSSLDSITEKEIQIALQNLMKNKTVIVIAHRLSTLNIMDRIIVIDNGKIVEDGRKEELINNNGLFRKMWDMQRDGVLVDE